MTTCVQHGTVHMYTLFVVTGYAIPHIVLLPAKGVFSMEETKFMAFCVVYTVKWTAGVYEEIYSNWYTCSTLQYCMTPHTGTAVPKITNYNCNCAVDQGVIQIKQSTKYNHHHHHHKTQVWWCLLLLATTMRGTLTYLDRALVIASNSDQ